jgi:predicted GIY-YIG superfamily endonuclease
MSWFTYIVECRDKSFYTGITWNLKKRISEHNSRVQSCLQISKVPVKLVYWEKFNDRFEAAKKEKIIKGWGRNKKILLIESLRKPR